MASAPVAAPATTSSSSSGANTSYLAPLSVLTSLFFMWGFLTCLNDVVSARLRETFDLSYFQTGLVQSAFFAAYFVMSLPSGAIVKRVGYKSGIIIGLLGVAAGCALFYPAAGHRSFNMFLVALFVLASGITLLQVAANPFVAVLGKPETASSRLTLTQAFNSFGTTIAPKIGKFLILSSAVVGTAELAKMAPAAREAYRAAEAASVQTPYIGLTIGVLILAGAIAAFKLPKIQSSDDGSGAAALDDASGKSAWSHPHLVFGALAIFVYVGAEVAIGNYIIPYFKQPYMGGFSTGEATDFLTYYWGGAMVGRFFGSLVTLRKFNAAKVLAIHAVGCVLLLAITMATAGAAGRWSILAVGFFNSIMFPTIFTLAIAKLGRHTGQGSGILCMAIVGGAIIPPLTGRLADGIGIHHCFIAAAVCYAYIAWYGAKGSLPRARAAV
ncbi:MAG: fucP [Myxococcales bacterium]|nr:fucP [Myxococcales bacterium]